MDHPYLCTFNNAKELHSFLKDSLASKINSYVYHLWKESRNPGAHKSAYKLMLKQVSNKMKKQVKEYALVPAENLHDNHHIKFIKSLHLLPPGYDSNLNGKVILKLAKFMKVCKASICNFSSSQRKKYLH